MKKLSVFIVDDEYRIAQLISKLIKWNELDLELQGLFDDSEMAFEEICRKQPDIVITDIKMPVMDGLELIKNVFEKELHPSFILVSGFREFEYAHKALKYGVEDYLLKPVKEIELNRVLKKICEEHEKKIEDLEENTRLKVEMQRNRTISNRDALNALEQNINSDYLETFNESFGQKLVNETMRVIIIQLDYQDFKSCDMIQDRLVLNNLLKITETQMAKHVKEQLYAIREDRTVSGILNYEQCRSGEVKQELYQVLSSIMAYVYGFSGYEVTIGLGSEERFETIRLSLQSARRRIRERIILGTGKIIEENDYRILHEVSVLETVLPYKNEILNARDGFSAAKLNSIIDQWMNKLRSLGKIDAMIYYESARHLVEYFFHTEELTGNIMEIKQKIMNEINHCYSTQMLTVTLKNRFKEAMEAIEKDQQQKFSKPVRDAIVYIENHFSEKITLEDVAEQIQLNPTYFSVIFKKELEKNFLTYLTEFRVEKAKELLRTTNDTMDSIAEQVGYTNTRYFSQCFDKIVGVKPSIYRKIYS
jgi:Response regulator containing CheY-like receiver domain and AraC-type DNA-binding domain